MWQGISVQLGDALGRDYRINQREKITGGDIHQAYRIDDGRAPLFVKINHRDKLDLFEREAQALASLAMSPHIKVPEVIHYGLTKDGSFLAMEWMPLGTGTASQWFQFGQQLARLHRDQSQAEYGFDDDNYIGTTVQPNRWQRNWARFFAEQRLGWQLQLAAEKGYQLGDSQAYIDAAANLLQGHQPTASLLHGDLWHGNTGFVDGEPVLFDPASYYGDRETDIAMTELFSRFPEDFYKGYDAEWPLDKHYANRRALYQLYHQLNHLNLFGNAYLKVCQDQLQRLLAQ